MYCWISRPIDPDCRVALTQLQREIVVGRPVVTTDAGGSGDCDQVGQLGAIFNRQFNASAAVRRTPIRSVSYSPRLPNCSRRTFRYPSRPTLFVLDGLYLSKSALIGTNKVRRSRRRQPLDLTRWPGRKKVRRGHSLGRSQPCTDSASSRR